MDRINWGRVLLGGLLAGLIINFSEFVLNGVVLQSDWNAAMKALNKPGAVTTAQIVGFNVWGFAAGVIAVWLYAAIRPRYGAGPRTAAIAGGGVWLTAYLLANAAPMILDLFPMRMMVLGLAVGLVEVVVGTMAGAWVYREESAVTGRAVAAGR
jgi:hypothetical protein